jgi:uncharacterized protein YdbL (DUF1318 family)
MNRLPAILCALATAACIKAPDVVLVDRATALEQQAGGSFQEIELKLTRAGIVPRPVPLTPEQMEALGIRQVALVDKTDSTEADHIDELLRQHCIGEGREGLLVDTHSACRGVTDRAAAMILIERVNRARVQLWRWMDAERKDSSTEALQRTWHKVHARGVVCGAWIQGEDGAWSEKKC